MNLYNSYHSYVQSVSCHEDVLVFQLTIYIHMYLLVCLCVYLLVSTYPFIYVFTSVHISMLR
jgi:hypothetical protein